MSALLSGLSTLFAAGAAIDAASAAKTVEQIQRPHVNIEEDYLDTTEGDERVFIKFKNFGQVPAADTQIHVVVYDGVSFWYIDSFVDSNVLPPGKEKISPSMPIPRGMVNVVFCINYDDVNGKKFRSAEAFNIKRAESPAGLTPLVGIGHFQNAARLRKEACTAIEGHEGT